jgi:hypothetical protein
LQKVFYARGIPLLKRRIVAACKDTLGALLRLFSYAIAQIDIQRVGGSPQRIVNIVIHSAHFIDLVVAGGYREELPAFRRASNF